jgi:hypothetical protein
VTLVRHGATVVFVEVEEVEMPAPSLVMLGLSAKATRLILVCVAPE